MNLNKTGEFIAKCRKEKGLTQEKLAKKLFISEKTISKWECGKGFPDSSLILPLCEVLDISANELLSGERLTAETYKKSAEKNIVALKDANEKNIKHLLLLEWVIGYIGTIFFLLAVFSAGFFVESLAWKIILLVAGFTSIFTVCGFCLHIERNAGFYECAHCHHKYIPTYSAVLWAMHAGRTRYLKCPKCGKYSWSRKRVQ